MRNSAIRWLALCTLFVGAACSQTNTPEPTADASPNETIAQDRPNFVIILADDAALMDFGAYGGEAATPNIDRLAARGALFTNFHASPMCAPSRAMLMTGVDSHRNGVPNLPIFLPAEYKKSPGYEGVLNNRVRTIASILDENGYDTLITGKWHLGHEERNLPENRGFDRSYILDGSGADNFEHRPYLPVQGKPKWFKNGVRVDLPDDFYSSRFLVDQMIDFTKEARAGGEDNPFFAYIGFQAVHIPIQAPREFIEKYEGVYDDGWDALRQQRFEKAKALGLVPATAVLGDMLPVLDSWGKISEDKRKLASKSMAVNAAMLEAMDYHFGRYIEYLESIGEFENTVFIITSDNGPEASAPDIVPGMNAWLESVGYSRDYETLGEKGSYAFIGPAFASAAAGPSAYFKFHAGQGGLRVPLIVSGPGVPNGVRKDAFSFITDITPSILEMAGIAPPDDPAMEPMSGKSFAPLLRGEQDRVYGAEELIGVEAAGQKAMFRGDYKLVNNGAPYGDGAWRLYDLSIDPGETNDLAAREPALFDEMMRAYETYAEENGVLEMPEGYVPLLEMMKSTGGE